MHFLVQNRVVLRIEHKNPLRGLYKEKILRIFHPFAEKNSLEEFA